MHFTRRKVDIIKYFIVFITFLLILPFKASAKGGSFNIETVTEDGFGDTNIYDFNNGYEFNNYMYTTTDYGTGGGKVFRSATGDTGSWTLVNTPGFGDSNNASVDAMIEFGSNLYITTANSSEGAEVWRSDSGTSWTPVVGGGATTLNGFGDSDNVIVRVTAVYNNELWAFTYNEDPLDNGIEAWRSSNGITWTQTTVPDFTNAKNAIIQQAFVFSSRLYVYVLDKHGSDYVIEVWYTDGGDTPSWTQVNSVGFSDLIDNAGNLWFAEYNSILYAGNGNIITDSEIWYSENGIDFTLSNQFEDSDLVYPVPTTKGLFTAVLFVEGQQIIIGGADLNIQTLLEPEYDISIQIYRYYNNNWVYTGITFEPPSFTFSGSVEFNNYYYVYGGEPGKILRVDLRPICSEPESDQTQLGDGVVDIIFDAGDIIDNDVLRAKVEYDLGDGYQKATLSENSNDISSTYGTVSVENDNVYQIGNSNGWIITSLGVNTVNVKWLSKVDEPNANTTNAKIRVSVSSSQDTGDIKEEYQVIVDNIKPDISNTNIIDGQTVTTNPFVIKTKAIDTASGVWKVDFYVDNNLLCTDTVADSDGYYFCSWDTDLYHSLIDLRAFDLKGNVNMQVMNTYVDLPETGGNVLGLQSIGLLLFVTSVFLNKKKKFNLK